MITLACLDTTVAAKPSELFARWVDVDTHPEWSSDLEWIRLEEHLAVGARGQLKPKRGPRSRFSVTELEDGRTFADTTHLLGAALTFRHRCEPSGHGARVTVDVTVSGPLAWLWARILGRRSMQTGIEGSLANLTRLIRDASHH